MAQVFWGVKDGGRSCVHQDALNNFLSSWEESAAIFLVTVFKKSLKFKGQFTKIIRQKYLKLTPEAGTVKLD